MDETPHDETAVTDDQTDAAESDDQRNERHSKLLSLAQQRFRQGYEAVKDDFDALEKVQEFIAGDQWPVAIKRERDKDGRPCLTLDKLGQYVRHVVNGALMRSRDVRVLAMSGDADDEVADVLAGMVRQITQTSSSKIAYERGLRHSTQGGFGYWRCKVEPVPGTGGVQLEIQVRPIREPRMVILDPFCEYPDGRDAKYVFVLTKLTKAEFEQQYPKATAEGVKSWHAISDDMVLPWIAEGSVVVAEYYYLDGDTMHWAICTPDQVLDEGVHHGNVNPIIRVVGDEYEYKGKQRLRGMVNNSSMDGQRAYNYAASAFTENVALAPIAPFVAAEGQIEPYVGEWSDAHRRPRPVLRYKPVTLGGQLAPPPQRTPPAGIPEGWQGMMANLIQDIEMVMGVARPNVLGTGGIPVQSGAGIDAQKDPGDINTFHYSEHWYNAIEQTGRVILAMIPHVYTTEQVVKIVGDDGTLKTAILNPNQQQPVIKQVGKDEKGMDRVLSTSYNHLLGRYDVAISTGPASATKKAETSKLMTTMVQAYPPIMEKAGDLVVASMDMAGADVLSKRLKAFLPPGVAEEDEAAQLQMLQQLSVENQQLKAQLQEAQQIVLGEREQAQAKLAEADMKARAELAKQQQEADAAMIQERLKHQGDLRIATMKAEVELEKNLHDNIVKILIEKIRANSKLDVEVFKRLHAATLAESHEQRMGGYLGVMEQLAPTDQGQPVETATVNDGMHL